MKARILNLILALTTALVSCSSELGSLPIDDISFNGPDEIRLQVGQSVDLSVNAPSSLKATYTWVYAKQVIGEGQKLTFVQDSPSSGTLTVIIKDADKNMRSFERKVYITRTTSYKVVGYLPSYKTDISMVQWDKLTHLNLSFARVKADGSLEDTAVRGRFGKLSSTAKANGVSLLLSVCGGAQDATAINTCLSSATARENLVKNIVQTVRDLSLDGVDMDYEAWAGGASQANKGYQEGLLDVLTKLRAALGPDAPITAALAGNALQNGWYSKEIMDILDYVTLMAYDKTGTWSKDIGPHAPFSYFESLCNVCLQQNVAKEKIVPGVPFYGRAFPDGKSSSAKDYSYDQIVKTFSGAENKDSIDSEKLWYDGIPAITQKCQYVKSNELGGIMIWEVTMDSTDPAKSLMNTINKALN